MNSPQTQPTAPSNQPGKANHESTQPVLEPFSAHHRVEWYYDHQIASVPSLGKADRALVDDWCSMVKHVFDSWPEAKPILLLADLRREASPSPYQSSKAYELLNYRDQHRAYVALLTKNTLPGQITRLVLRAKNRNNGEVRQFFSFQEAMDWLVKLRK
ncbi:MAG TPA: hypothetical protein VKQ72_05965 [Aggregatilineales bacterium]|nr:hypothetical protein [Aggregatilineales bacterium]